MPASNVARISMQQVPVSLVINDVHDRELEVRAFGEQVALGIHIGVRNHVYAVLDDAGVAALREWCEAWEARR